MSSRFADEIAANLERAEQSIKAARQLASGSFYDFGASRAYYAAFYAATALLLREGLEFGKHSGVIASIHQRFVKTGKLDKEQGKALNWLFELRGVIMVLTHMYHVNSLSKQLKPQQSFWKR